LTAHQLAYRFVTPDPDARVRELQESGHGYLQHLPLLAGVLVAALVAGLINRLLLCVRGRVSPWTFFALPLAGFALQEHLERLVHDGSFPLAAALQPTFLVGLLLQLPFALLAFAVAWALLGLVERLRRVFSADPPVARARASVGLRAPASAGPARIAALALGYAQRGPPLLLAL
jgi:hypothetical protein